MPGTTTRYGLTTLLGTDLARDIDTHVTSLANGVDTKMTGYSEGVLASRPTSTGGSPGITGRLYRATNTGQVFQDHGTGWNEIQGAGDLKPTARSTAPDGWLLCDGSAVSRSTYAALFAAIGVAYGAGDGSTTFNVPNLKGRVPVGRDAAQAEFDVLGETGGAKTHTLSTAEMPAHTHTVELTQSHTHNDVTDKASRGILNIGTVQMPSGSTGGGGAHQNLPPYQVFNWLVKT